MAQQSINIGAAENDGTGDPIRTAFGKVNDNFDELYGAVTPVGGIIMWSGTIATIPSPWALCDGTLNAPGPDLRDKFIVGATQDAGGVAKSNVEGSLKQSGGVTGVSHSAHADLTHAGGAVADHTGLTHGVTIANHPDLTHAALSHPAQTFTHADHAIASVSHAHAAITLTHADHSLASFSGTEASGADVSIPTQPVTMPSMSSATAPSHSHAAVTVTANHATQAYSKGGTASNVLPITSGTAQVAGISLTTAGGVTITSWTGTAGAVTGSRPSLSHSHAAITVTHADHSVASFSGTHAATTLTHADHSFPSLSHQAIGTHAGTDYGVHGVTAPAAHGTAGTLTHAFTEPNDHAISAHDTVLSLPVYFALAFIQRMA